MITFRPTPALAKKLDLSLSATIPAIANRAADWCVQEFRAARRTYLLYCNTPSLYPVIALKQGVTDGEALLFNFIMAAEATLRPTPGAKVFELWVQTEMSGIQYLPIPDQSVQASINDLMRIAQGHLEEGLAPAVASRRTATTPLGILGLKSPEAVFPRLRGVSR
jgi:hypothetical protein